MIREKTIVLSACLVISVVIFEAASMLSRDYSPSMKEVVQDNNPMDNASNVGEKNDTQPLPLQSIGWGDDIFYDRSNIYNSWFKLTGITQFEDGYKAIINGEIVHELNQVRGFKVKEITKNRVILERNQYSVTLKLEK